MQIAEGAPTALTFPIRVIGTATVTDNAGNNIDDDYIFDLTLSRVDGENYEPSPASLSLQIAEGAPANIFTGLIN